MVTHEAHAAAFADRLVVLRDGKVAHDGTAGSEGDVLELMKAVA
jgi:putative ABC transport system ATP-binding protein